MDAQNVADILRCLAIPAAAITAAISIRVVVDHRYRTTAQVCRFLGLAFVCLGLAVGQYHALGHDPFWPALILLWIGLAFSLGGTLPLLRKETHA